MRKILETIVNELNPRHDFDDITFRRLKGSFSNRLLTHLYNAGNCVCIIAKPIVRGAVVGGIIGGVVNYSMGYLPLEGAMIGGRFGIGIDVLQFTVRAIIKY